MERILAIDDTKSILKVIESILVKAGYDCKTAMDGAAGIALVRSFKPDLILVDAEMPAMNGFEVCANVKSNPSTLETPVIFLSGYNDIEHRIKAFEAGAQDFIAKPFHEREVLVRIDTQLRMLKSQREIVAAKNAAIEASRAKSAFLSRMSHEFKTPLNSIIGYARHISQAEVWNSTTKSQVEIIQESGEQLLKIVEGLIFFAEIESKTPRLNCLDTDLVPMIQQMCSLISNQCKQQGIQFHQSLNTPESFFASTDPFLLRTFLYNLLSVYRSSLSAVEIRFVATISSHNEISSLQLKIEFLNRIQHESDGNSSASPMQGLEFLIAERLLKVLAGTIQIEHAEKECMIFDVHLPIWPAQSYTHMLHTPEVQYDLWVTSNHSDLNLPEVASSHTFVSIDELLTHLHKGGNRWLIDEELANTNMISPERICLLLDQHSWVTMDVLMESIHPMKELRFYHNGFRNCGTRMTLFGENIIPLSNQTNEHTNPVHELAALSSEERAHLVLAAKTLDTAALELIATSIFPRHPEVANWIRMAIQNYSFGLIEKAMEGVL